MITQKKYNSIVGHTFVSYRCPCCKTLIGPNDKWCHHHDTVTSRISYKIRSWYEWKIYRIKFLLKLYILKDPDAIKAHEAQIRLSKMISRVGVSTLPRGDAIHGWKMNPPPDNVYAMVEKFKEGIPCQEIPLEGPPKECVLGRPSEDKGNLEGKQ